MNSVLSCMGSAMRPARQSALACSMRSLREETKFHQIWRAPRGSPPKSIRREASRAVMQGVPSAEKIAIWPERYSAPSISMRPRSEEHTSELQSLMRISYAFFCFEKKKIHNTLHKRQGTQATNII